MEVVPPGMGRGLRQETREETHLPTLVFHMSCALVSGTLSNYTVATRSSREVHSFLPGRRMPLVVYIAPATLVIIAVALKLYFTASTGVCRSENRLDGKTVIVTGASAGIGKETALDLARRGARVVMACRNVQKALKVRDAIIKETHNDNVLVRELDLTCFESVRKFAAEVIENECRIDVLINNAGIIDSFKSALTKDGIESQMQTNHFSHFLLTNLLMGVILKTEGSRIINVSSSNHSFCKRLDLANIRFARPGTGMKFLEVYNASKLCNVLFTRHLAQLLEDRGSHVTVNVLHPGTVRTEILDHMILIRLALSFVSFFIKTAKEGAQTSIHLTVADDVAQTNGQYFSDCQVAKSSELSRDRDLARKLWELSEEIVDLKPEERHLTH